MDPFIHPTVVKGYIESLRLMDNNSFKSISDLNVRFIDTISPSLSPSSAPNIEPPSLFPSSAPNIEPFTFPPTVTSTTNPPSTTQNKAIVIWTSVLSCLIALMICAAAWFIFIHNRNNNVARSIQSLYNKCLKGSKGNTSKYNNEDAHDDINNNSNYKTNDSHEKEFLSGQLQRNRQHKGKSKDIRHLSPIKSVSQEDDDDSQQNIEKDNALIVGKEVSKYQLISKIQSPLHRKDQQNVSVLVSEGSSSGNSSISPRYAEKTNNLTKPLVLDDETTQGQRSAEGNCTTIGPTKIMTGSGGFSHVHMLRVSDIDDIDFTSSIW